MFYEKLIRQNGLLLVEADVIGCLLKKKKSMSKSPQKAHLGRDLDTGLMSQYKL